MNKPDLDQEIELALMDLRLGLPSRCECATPCQEMDPYQAIIRCALCGGLVLTYEEIASAEA